MHSVMHCTLCSYTSKNVTAVLMISCESPQEKKYFANISNNHKFGGHCLIKIQYESIVLWIFYLQNLLEFQIFPQLLKMLINH